MTIEHYENFPVASILLPPKLRPAVEAVYAFARSADDIADEGDADVATRLEALQSYRNGLDRIAGGHPAQSPMFDTLHKAVDRFSLPLEPMYDLLSAFEQDVQVKRYADFAALLDYCRRSANPVGRLMLCLYGRSEDLDLSQSDDICTGLQLTNFWQDVAVDWTKNRIYVPAVDLDLYSVSEKQIASGVVNQSWCDLMGFEVVRARSMLLRGAPLATRLPGRMGWELRLVVQGGLCILEKIEAAGYDVFRHRPVLGKPDWLRMAWRALRM